MAYAVIRTGAKQYKVAKGDTIEVEKLEVEAGKPVEFSEVLLFADGGNVKVGKPLVDGAKVLATVNELVKAPKVIAYKFKRRKGYHRTVGHRQKHTSVTITEIMA